MLLTSKVPLRDADGEVSGVLGIYTDITSRKQAEQELRESEQRLRVLVDHAPEAIVLLDTDTGKFVDTNENAQTLFGLDHESLLDLDPVDVSPAKQPDGQDSRAAAKDFVDQTLAGGAPVFEWTHKNTAGEKIPCEIRLVKLPYRDRNLVRGSVTDISERLAAQQALKKAHDDLERRVVERTAELAQSEERWRSLVQTAPDFILTVDPDGTIRYINRMEEGFDANDVIGTSAFDYVLPEYHGPMKDCYEEVLRTGEVRAFESAVPTPDGSVTWYSSRVGPFIENGKVTGVTSIATDVTKAKLAEEKLKAEDELLRQLLDLQEKERQMVAYDIHDGFVQDVVGAHMRLEGVRDVTDQPSIQEALDGVCVLLQRGIAESRRMIRDLRPMVLDESGVVEAIHHLIADEKKQDGLKVSFEHGVRFDRLEPMLEGAIFRIVQESLNNVKQHARTKLASIVLGQEGDRLCIEIADHGVGFDQKLVEPDRFGLRGIQERARLFGGTASIRSKPGAGTVVHAELPIYSSSATEQTGGESDSTTP